MKLNRKWIMVLALVMSMAMATTGTLAYLTDRDSEANVFTMGNVEIDLEEEFVQGSELIPGVKIEKEPTITNTGKNAAWVWATVAVPADLDDALDIGWPAVDDANWTKLETVEQVDKDEVPYNVYTYLYKTALAKGDATTPIITSVTMKPEVDIDPDGKLNLVVKGEAEELGWNYNDNDQPIVYVSAYAIQTEGFDTVKDGYEAYNAQWTTEGGVNNGLEWGTPAETVTTADELQAALDAAEGDTSVMLGADIAGDITITQKPGVHITIEGAGNTFAGVITVDGKSACYEDASLTINNVNFEAESISADACIRLGNGTNATRYTNNVTVSNCTFNVPGAVGVKSYTGGDKNLTITECTASADLHSMLQAKGVDGILVEGCTVNSKNGLNFNNSTNVTIDNCKVDTTGYAVRFGESSGGVGSAETYAIKNSTLKSACDDGDAVIILRGTADYATLTITNTTIEGTTQITNTATGATVIQ